MATQANPDDDEYVHNLGRILRTLAKEARERGGSVGEIIGQGLVSWQGTEGIGLVPFLAKKAGSGECWIFVRKGERWSLTRSIADAMQIITGGAPKRPYRADERELNNSKSIMTRILGGKPAWAAEMARRWREAVVSSRIDKDRGRPRRPPAAGAAATPGTGLSAGAAVKTEPAAQHRGARPAGSSAPQPPPPATGSPAKPLPPAGEAPLSAGGVTVAAVPSATAFPLSVEATGVWYDAAAAAFDAAAAAAPRQPGQALGAMGPDFWAELEASHTKVYVLAKELAAARACLDVVETGERRWTAQEPPAPAWHRVKANAVGAVIEAGDLEASCLLYPVGDPSTPPGTAAQVAAGYAAAAARGCALVRGAAAEAARLGVGVAPRPAGLAEWATAAAAELGHRRGGGGGGGGARPGEPCDKRDYCCLPVGHRGHCRKARPEDEEPAATPVMGKRRSAPPPPPPPPGELPAAGDPAGAASEGAFAAEYGLEGPAAAGERANEEGEALCYRNSYCVKLAGHMGRCKIRAPGEDSDGEGPEFEGPVARRAAAPPPGTVVGAPAEGEDLPPGVEKCTRHKHCVKEQGHMGRCRIRAPPRRPPGAAARERQLKAVAAAVAGSAGAAEADKGSDDSMDEDVDFEPCPKDPDCVNMAGHRGRCKIRRPPAAEGPGTEAPAAKRRRPAAALDIDLGHLALLAEVAAVPSPGFVSPPPAGAAAPSPGPKSLGRALAAALPAMLRQNAGAEGVQQPGEGRAAAAAAAAAAAGAEKAAAAAFENAGGVSPHHLDVAAVLAAAAAMPEEPAEAEAEAAAAAPPAAEPVAPQPTVEAAEAQPAGPGAPGGDAVKPEEPAAAPAEESDRNAVPAAPAAATAAEAPPMALPPSGLNSDVPVKEAPAAAAAPASLAEQSAESGAALAVPADNGTGSGGP